MDYGFFIFASGFSGVFWKTLWTLYGRSLSNRDRKTDNVGA